MSDYITLDGSRPGQPDASFRSRDEPSKPAERRLSRFRRLARCSAPVVLDCFERGCSNAETIVLFSCGYEGSHKERRFQPSNPRPPDPGKPACWYFPAKCSGNRLRLLCGLSSGGTTAQTHARLPGSDVAVSHVAMPYICHSCQQA